MATVRNIGVLAPLERRLRMRGVVRKGIDLDYRRDVLNRKTVHFRSNDLLNLVTVQMLGGSERTVLCLCLLVNESPALLLPLLTSQILSFFYRSLMSALPPPPAGPHWHSLKVICALLVRPHCRLRTGTALEPRSEKAVKLSSVCCNWSPDPLFFIIITRRLVALEKGAVGSGLIWGRFVSMLTSRKLLPVRVIAVNHPPKNVKTAFY